MVYNPDVHRRRSIRLPGHDYARPGAYFITICAHERLCSFGEIVQKEMRPNEIGRIVVDEWNKTGQIRKEIQLDNWVIMPNHFHAIVWITNRRGDRRSPITRRSDDLPGPKSKSIGAMMAGFKSTVTKRVNTIRKTPGAKLWQRNYYEHIIRDEPELSRIRQYVADNPAQWELDQLHPRNQGNRSTS